MELERSTKVQAGAGLLSILVFVGGVLFVGTRDGAAGLDPSAGLLMVAVLAFYVVFMSVMGLALSDDLTGD